MVLVGERLYAVAETGISQKKGTKKGTRNKSRALKKLSF